MKTTPAGQLNRRVSLQTVLREPDANGIRSDLWTTYATVWAKISSKDGREKQTNKAIVEAADMVVEIRYRRDVERSQRCLYGTRQFLINDVDDPEQAHCKLILKCTEIVASG